MLKLKICRSAFELVQLKPLWSSLLTRCESTAFQNFDLNLLAARMFAEREAPYVVCAEASYGAVVIPAAVRKVDNSLRLLGEDLFDYRKFLHFGEDDVVYQALSFLAGLEKPLQVVALRPEDCGAIPSELELEPFSAAPALRLGDVTPETFSQMHTRLARNLRRLQRLGYEVKSYNGENSHLLRALYRGKAEQDPASLFHDPVRIEFLVNAALLQPELFEIFTLECGPRLGAALVTLRDGSVRRFYTGWFAPEIEKHSPALSLIYEVSRQSLDEGLDCDYMTGEQPYKLRLATSSVPLYKLRATSDQLANLAAPAFAEMNVAS